MSAQRGLMVCHTVARGAASTLMSARKHPYASTPWVYLIHMHVLLLRGARWACLHVLEVNVGAPLAEVVPQLRVNRHDQVVAHARLLHCLPQAPQPFHPLCYAGWRLCMRWHKNIMCAQTFSKNHVGSTLESFHSRCIASPAACTVHSVHKGCSLQITQRTTRANITDKIRAAPAATAAAGR